MLKTRVLSAIVFTPAVVGLLAAGGLWTDLFILIVGQLCLWEFLALTQVSSHSRLGLCAHLTGLVWAATELGIFVHPGAGCMVPFAFVVMAGTTLTRPLPLSYSTTQLACAFMGVVWCCILLTPLSLLRHRTGDGLWIALCTLLCTWAADTGAYFVGQSLGRTPLYPKVSPKKTLEGAAGGVLLAAAVGYGLLTYGAVPYAFSLGATLGALVAVAGTMGDLTESLLKRSVGAKDSSQIIPGHGGVLDRFDALLFSVPVVHAALACFWSGGEGGGLSP